MRNKKIALLALATITSTNLLIAQPAFAFSQNKVTVNAEDSYNESDWYAENKIETVYIENTQYTYLYHYENANKTITITNNLNDTIEKIMIDQSSNMYLNGNLIESYTQSVDNKEENPMRSSLARASWQTLGNTEKSYISWGQATTAATLAALIAGKVGSLGPSGVIAAMGIAALGAIAGQCAGGTVYYTLQVYQAPFTTPMYRSLWGFKASTGDYYGDYIYTWPK